LREREGTSPGGALMRQLSIDRLTGLAFVCLAVAALWSPISAPADVLPERPRAKVDTSPPPPPTRTIAVAAGGDLQAALNAAQPGDLIALEAGATFTGNFRLPLKSGNGWIVVRSAAPDARVPPGTRVTPASAPSLARVISPNSGPAIATDAGAHHWWLAAL